MTEATPSLQEGGASPATPPAEAGSDSAASPVTPAPVSAESASTADVTTAPEQPKTEAVKTEAVEAPKPDPSLLSTAEAKTPTESTAEPVKDAKSDAKEPAPDQKTEAKEEAKADAKETKSDDAAPADKTAAPQPPVKYEPFKLPEGVKLDDKRVKEFTDVLDSADLKPQDRAQKLVDFHVAEMNRVVQEQQKNQIEAWKTFTDSLKSDYKKDADLGGNRQDTSLGIAKSVIEQLGGTPEQKADLYRMLDHTGMGNYVGLSRLLNNIYEQYMSDVTVPANPPTKANGRRGFQETMYGDS